jgi:hypothetical protein
MLCQRPERDFPYLGEVSPLLEEGLLIPFYVDGEAVGTIWVISHNESRRFDAEDLRVMTNLATFAAAAYQTLLTCADGSDAATYGDVRSGRCGVVAASPQTGANDP